MEERRYLRRQVELINQWNEQGVLNERMAAERKEDEFERGVNRQRESWREQEFLMRYEATYASFMASSARFERWMAGGGLEKLGEKMRAEGASELEISAVKETAHFAQQANHSVQNLKDKLDAFNEKAPTPNMQALKQVVSNTMEAQKDLNQNLAPAYFEKTDGKNVTISISINVLRVLNGVQMAKEQSEIVQSDPNATQEEKKAAQMVEKTFSGPPYNEAMLKMDRVTTRLGYKPFSEMNKNERDEFFERVKLDQTFQNDWSEAYMPEFGKKVELNAVLTQIEMAQNYDSYQKNTALLLQSAIENYNKHIKSAASEVGPISAFTEFQTSLKNAVFSATKEVAVETTDLALKGKTHNYSVIKMTNPDTKENIQIFVEKNGEDYDLGNFGRLMGEKINDLIDRKNYPNLSDSDYRRLAEETLYNFVSTGMGGQLTINENGHDQHVNSINIALSKMAAINVLIQKNGSLPDEDTLFDNLRGALSRALKEKALQGHGVDYAKDPALLEEAIEKAIREVEKGTFNTKEFYDMSAELQRKYSNQNENIVTKTSDASNQTDNDNKILEEANNSYNFT